jgi:scyllo-inositol 2-dehydrogenase (NADP+)
MTVRAGLIGFGLAGRYFHAALMTAAGFELRAVVTSRVDELRTLYPGVAAVGSHTQLIERSDVDLIVVASPSQFHFEHAHAALLGGKHVVVDKPVSATLAQVDLLAQAASDRKVKLAVFQNRRWDSDFLTISQLLREQRLGEVTTFRARWDRFRPEVVGKWREPPVPAGGMLYDLGSHLIDQALCFFGRPDWLQADLFAQRRGATVDDTFEILMAKDRLRISLSANYLSSPGDWRYVIHGSRGSFFKSGIDPQEDQSRAGLKPLDAGFGVEDASLSGKLVIGATGESQVVPTAQGRWLTFYELLKRSIETDTAPPVSVQDARAITEIIEAAQRSSAEGRRIYLS